MRGLRAPICPECGQPAPGAPIREVEPLAGACILGGVGLVQATMLAVVLSTGSAFSPLATAAVCCATMIASSVIILGAAIALRRVIGPLLIGALVIACGFDVALVARLLEMASLGL
jgi:hypothetical protein